METATANDISSAPATDTFRLLSARHLFILGMTVLLLALAGVWVLQPVALLPWSGTVHSALLPQILTGVLLGALAVLSPFFSAGKRDEPFGRQLLQIVCLCAWIAVIELFVLLVSSRLVPLEASTIAAVTVTMALLAFVFQLLSRAFPKAFATLMFLWLIGMPVMAYFTAEIYMMTLSGNAIWAEVAGPGGETIRALVRWLLNLSPSTFVSAMLNGVQADGSDLSLWPYVAFAGAAVAGMLVLARQKSGRQSAV
ncbi:MAG TPA: hypothetical protein VEJ63_08640 [Planctomycetota bacterium]|nr:hypothetical protein [Planctomycetota bacterium]